MRLFPTLRCKYPVTPHYQIPSDYQNSFYLANASLFQIINYFVHKSYQIIFPELIEKVKAIKALNDEAAICKVKDYIKRLEFCDQFLDFRFPIRRNHGGVDIVRGMRAYHGLSLNHGATLGGFRLVENLNRHTAQGFAVFCTYRNACYGLDFSGAHGGLKICGDIYEPTELKEALHGFTNKLSNFHGLTDVIEPDLGCGSNSMAYMREVAGDHIKLMGTSPEEGGLADYNLAGAKAVLCILKMFMENDSVMNRINMSGSLKDKTFVIQGLGRMGRHIAMELSRAGAICVGVRDDNSTIYDTGGISVKALLRHYREYGNIINFSLKTRESANNAIFTELCDILVLAAVERAVTCHIADNLKAKIIVEACNGPVTPTADKILLKKSKLLIPSILVGGGHTVMSYIEYMKQLGDKLSTSEEEEGKGEIKNGFENIIKDTTTEIFNIETEWNLELNFRAAAYIKAIRKIFNCLLETEGLIRPLDERFEGLQ